MVREYPSPDPEIHPLIEILRRLMLKIDISNNTSQIRDYKSLPSDLRTKIERTLSFFAPGARFSKAFKIGVWDGRVKCVNPSGVFPTGLLGRLAKDIPNYRLFDLRIKPKPTLQLKWGRPGAERLPARDSGKDRRVF